MENMKLNLQELVNEYAACKVQQSKDSVLQKINIKPYVSYATKMALAEKIVKHSSTNQTGQIHFNTANKHLLNVYTIITHYTNIEMSAEHMIEDFDLLDSKGMIEAIFKLIPDHELTTFATVLDFATSDFYKNNYETKAYIERQIERVTTVAETFLTPILPFIETLGKKLESMDENDIEKLTSDPRNILKFLKK